MVPCKMEPIKYVHDKLLVTTYILQLLEKYKLIKFLCFRSIVYPRLVKMFYANLSSVDDKVSCYVMHKHIIIDFEMLAKGFKMEASPLKLTVGSSPD